MDAGPETISDTARAIQLALAPVFLLTGTAGLLNVMTGRLSRIVDRGRALSERHDDAAPAEQSSICHELQSLERRRHFTGIAITACVCAALLLCMVIATLFAEVMFHGALKWLIGGLFTASTVALIVSLAFFLREVHLATHAGRFNFLHPDDGTQKPAPTEE